MLIKKKIYIVLSLILLLVFTTGCQNNISETAGPENTNLAQNEFTKYYFYYPNDWTLDSNNTFISIISGDSLLTPANRSISVMQSDLIDTKMTAQDFWEYSKTLVNDTFNEFVEVSTDETKVADLNAFNAIYTAKITDKVYKFKQTFIVRGGVVYIITYTATDLDFEKGINAFNTVIQTFKFK